MKKTDEEKIYEFVKKHQPTTAMEIRAGLKLADSVKLSTTLARLRSSGQIKGKGATRAMAYTASKK